MRLTIAVAAMLLALTGAASAKEWKEIRIATEGAYPPFNFVGSNGELQGFDVDIAKALCDKIGAKCTVVAQDWDGLIPALLASKYDAIAASMSITEERKQQVDFTERYASAPVSFVAPKDTKLTGVTPADLKGKIVGAQSSTTHATMLEDVYGPEGVTVKLYPTLDEANADLKSGRVDTVFADKIVLLDWLKKDGADCCKILGDVDDKQYARYFGEGIGLAVRKGDQDLKELLSKAIADIRADGTYDTIAKKYFDFEIY
ncbi:ABC transporter substrate-binding protein [Chelatococcus daeguensis]|nr:MULTISPECIES: ABC transporter substrate-binding protein [Chelatococcus]MBM3084886.1 ABC transporter substrate-binding protein [Chelatococcus daeguensis]CUA87857.1 amino acid ABC transporter substrate-binding protein, PAAT family (TC 3.A.1.3.-) [Chelatococcus sambhunathii]